MHRRRINALVRKLKQDNIGALLITSPENIFYLTSLDVDKAALIVSPGKILVVTDFIYKELASKSLRGIETRVVKNSFAKTINGAIKDHKIKKIGFESQSISFRHYESLKLALRGTGLIPTSDIVESLREIKDNKEAAAIKRALKITSGAFRSTKRRLRPAATERSISNYIKGAILRNGGDGCSFEPIVATQPLSSQPHYAPRAKKLGRNKAVLLDMGARLNGYNSDLTRMCLLGKISPKFARLYGILSEAQKRAIEHVRPGAKISDIDLAARQHIDNEGLGRFFGHGLGHGVGLKIHEKPFITRDNHDLIKAGMIFTIEPGIYIPGFGGLRIEDMVRVNKKGCEVLTDDIDKSI